MQADQGILNNIHPFNQDITLRLLYLVSHPIQYQAPLLRKIAAESDIDLHVLFEHLDTAERYHDSGFHQDITWDVPLTEGYAHAAVQGVVHLGKEIARADVLWVHGWDTGLKRKALKLAKKAGVPVLMRGENTDAAMPDGWGLRGLLKRFYLARIFANCSGFLCIGSDNRQYYERRGIGSERLFSMPYTVDNDFFSTHVEQAKPGRGLLRKDLGIPENSPVVLYAGKLQARKHPLTLLQAFERLDPEKTDIPFLLYVGDGEQRATLERDAAGLGERVRVLGFKNQTELPAYYDLADVFVLASEKEPWGLGVNEAMVGGCVPIVSDECGCAQDLADDACGRIVKPGNAQALSDALGDLLSDRPRLKAMGEAAKTRISTWGLDESVAGLLQALATFRK